MVQRVRQLREGRRIGLRAFGPEQPGTAAADQAGNLEARTHLPGARPGRLVERISIGRLAVVKAFAQAVQPAQHRAAVQDCLAVVGKPHRRDHVVHRVLEFVRERGHELGCVEHRLQGQRDVAVAGAEGTAHALHQLRRRLLGHEVRRKLPAHVVRGGGVAREPGQLLHDLGPTPATDLLAQQQFLAHVVARRIELGRAIAHIKRLLRRREVGLFVTEVQPQAGQHAGQLLHVLLRVTTINAQRVQLHHFAGVVFVDALGRVLFVVEVTDHRRVGCAGDQQVAKLAQGVCAQPAFVVAYHHAQVRLVLVHVEVVEPEPRQLFLQLVGRVQGAQQRLRSRIAGQPVHILLVGLLRGFLGVVVGQRIGVAAALLHVNHPGRHSLLEQCQRVDLRLRARRQAGIRGGV